MIGKGGALPADLLPWVQCHGLLCARVGPGSRRLYRDALGMTAADLAARMGISGASVRAMEETEVSGGTLRLSTLRRAAEAMNCTLVYAFVPNERLEQTVVQQARWVLREQMSSKPADHGAGRPGK